MNHERLQVFGLCNQRLLKPPRRRRLPDPGQPERTLQLNSRSSSFFAIILLLLIPYIASGQAVGGRIAGSVKDASGAVVPGSSLVLTNVATGVSQSAISDESGVFNFPAVPIGDYELKVTASGFNSYRQTQGLRINVKTVLSIDVVLQIAQAAETVEVTENTREVQTADTQIGQTIESKQVTDIPLNGPQLHRSAGAAGGCLTGHDKRSRQHQFRGRLRYRARSRRTEHRAVLNSWPARVG